MYSSSLTNTNEARLTCLHLRTVLTENLNVFHDLILRNTVVNKTEGIKQVSHDLLLEILSPKMIV
jgi:hypothetical protein